MVANTITLGVCVMEKTVKCGSESFSGPMLQILERLESFGEFDIVHFGDKVILEEPTERWPICDCLIAFYSTGYPLEKAEAYAILTSKKHLLHDRRRVYERLEMFGINVPKYASVNREVPNQELDYFVEEEDFVEVRGERFWKPFVEKPIHGDDHSIMTYYPSSAGGGMKELLRKIMAYSFCPLYRSTFVDTTVKHKNCSGSDILFCLHCTIKKWLEGLHCI